ncbi:MAG: hypothetical protein M3279_10845 [Actinomycetota bacterium]|nr:hypothetical protein [Actinomycetota bacterium]
MSMTLMRKSVCLAGALTAGLIAAAPGAAGATEASPVVARCEAIRVGTTIQVVGLAAFTGPAIDVALVCHIYVNGSYAGSVGGVGVGQAAVASGVITNAPPGDVRACAEAHSTGLTGSSSYRQC